MQVPIAYFGKLDEAQSNFGLEARCRVGRCVGKLQHFNSSAFFVFSLHKGTLL